MKPNESLADYTLHILKESRKLRLNDDEIKQTFIQGLSDDLKEHVLLQNPATLEETLNAAQDKDAAKQTIRGLQNLSLNNLLPHIETYFNKERQFENKEEHNLIRQLQDRISQLERNSDNRFQRTRNNRRNGYFCIAATVRDTRKINVTPEQAIFQQSNKTSIA